MSYHIMSAHGETQHTCDQCDVIMDVVHMIVEQVVMDNINQKKKRKIIIWRTLTKQRLTKEYILIT